MLSIQSQFSASKNNNNTDFHSYNVLGTALSTLHVLTHLILTVAYKVSTIIHEENEAQRVYHLPKVTQLVSNRART